MAGLTANHNLPLELVREILFYVCAAPEESSAKAPWSSVYPVAVSCRAYRAIALEEWFRVFNALLPNSVHDIEGHFPQILDLWTRELHLSPAWDNDLPAWDLSIFRRLRLLRVNHPPFPSKWQRLTSLVQNGGNIVQLDMRGIMWPRPDEFMDIARLFPRLQVLRTAQRWSWCGLCNTCSLVRFAGTVPEKLLYTDGFGLPIHYARALSTLEHLHTVSMTVPYAVGERVVVSPNTDLWAGECEACVEMLYDDAEFRHRWSSRKSGVLLSGEDESRKIYLKPPSLKLVEWIFNRHKWSSRILEEEDEVEAADAEGDEEYGVEDSDS